MVAKSSKIDARLVLDCLVSSSCWTLSIPAVADWKAPANFFTPWTILSLFCCIRSRGTILQLCLHKNFLMNSCSTDSDSHSSYSFSALSCLVLSRRHINLYHSLGQFSRWQTDNMFSNFSQKIYFDFSCKLPPKFAWNANNLF